MFDTCQYVSVCLRASICRLVLEPICLIFANMGLFVFGTTRVSWFNYVVLKLFDICRYVSVCLKVNMCQLVLGLIRLI